MNPSPLPDYSQYSINDFVLDDSFRQWVFQPTEETMSFWHTFMLRHPEQQAVIEEATSILLHLRVHHDDLTDASRERIWQVLDAAHDRQWLTSAQQPARSQPFLKRWIGYPFRNWQVAASLTGLLLLAGGGWVWRHYWSRQEVHTNYGEVRTVTLPDGSLVRLNGNSTLTYPNDWIDNDDREVWLEGEAFFKVAKKQTSAGRLKFVTHTPNLDISVLGTQFNVNTRRGNTLVVLAEGKVELSKPNDQKARVILMKPGDLATAQAGIEQVEVRPAKPQVHTAWTRQQFAFENTALRDIAQQLTDTWGITLIFEDKALADRRFTGNLSSQDLETLIATLTATFELQADREGNQIYLRRLPEPNR
jgi:ferric-dicitrate binding protein FerR (iron transport regulator)